MKLTMSMIFAKDVERMAAFYRDGVGLSVIPAESSEGWVVFDAGGTRLALHAIPPAIAAGITIARPPKAREDTPIKLIFTADDLAAARARLAAHGATMFEPRSPRWCDGLDPEGNVFQVMQG